MLDAMSLNSLMSPNRGVPDGADGQLFVRRRRCDHPRSGSECRSPGHHTPYPFVKESPRRCRSCTRTVTDAERLCPRNIFNQSTGLRVSHGWCGGMPRGAQNDWAS